MLNFLAFLGWNPGGDKEIFTRKELIETFDINRIQVSGAQMNLSKLDWINKEHIKLLPPEEIEKNILEWLPENIKENPQVALKLVPLIFERISKWGDVPTVANEFSYIVSHFSYPKNIDHLPDDLKKTIKHLQATIGFLENQE